MLLTFSLKLVASKNSSLLVQPQETEVSFHCPHISGFLYQDMGCSSEVSQLLLHLPISFSASFYRHHLSLLGSSLPHHSFKTLFVDTWHLATTAVDPVAYETLFGQATMGTVTFVFISCYHLFICSTRSLFLALPPPSLTLLSRYARLLMLIELQQAAGCCTPPTPPPLPSQSMLHFPNN